MERALPSNLAAEKVLLGTCLLREELSPEIEDAIRSDHFLLDSHRVIYKRMQELARAGSKINIVTLAECLGRHKDVAGIGGVAFLASLTEGLPFSLQPREYIAIVREKAMLRKLLSIARAAEAKCWDESVNSEEIIASLNSDLAAAEDSGADNSDLESVGQWLGQNDVFAEREPGIPTGIEAHDELTGGLRPEELTIIAARTSMGKTAMAATMTWHIASRGKSVGVWLNEQNKRSFVGRMLCGRANVSFRSLKENTLDWVERNYLQDAEKEFRTWPIFWDQRGWMSVASISSKARRLKRSGDLDVILIDQLSGVSNEGFWEKGKRSDEIVGEKCRALKQLAMQLKVPVVLFHQVNRAGAKNTGARPTLLDLQDSGKIEQCADNVDFLHRPSYYDRSSEEADEIIRAKARDGETGTVKVQFVGQTCCWKDREKR